MSAKIKIIYIMPTLDRGGAERFLTDLLLNIDRSVFEPHLLLFKRGGSWIAELAAENIPMTILKKRWLFDPFNFWQIYQTIRHIRPEIVHTQLGGDIYGRLAARLAGIPAIISTEQNVNPDESWFMNILKRLTGRWADQVVAITQAVKDDAKARYSLPELKLVIIPNGLDTERFRPAGRAANKSGFVFGTIGRLVPQKGHEVLIDAVGRLGSDIRLSIAGDGPLRARLQEKITQAGLGERIELLGPVQDIPGFLGSLDAFVFPSLWEGQGIAILEAAAAGLPVVASAVDGIKEVLSDDTGWLVPAGDPEALSRQMDWLARHRDDPEVKAKIQQLRERIVANYDIRSITRRYEDLYRRLAERAYEDTTSK